MPSKPKSNIVYIGNLTYDQKKGIIEKRLKDPKITQASLSNWAKDEFNLISAPSQGTISNILKNADNILKSSFFFFFFFFFK